MLNITLYLMHPCNVITAGLTLFFHRANNGLFSSTLIFFLVLNKTMETTKGETYTIAKEQAFIMDVCKTTVCSKIRYAFFISSGSYENWRNAQSIAQKLAKCIYHEYKFCTVHKENILRFSLYFCCF